MSADRAGLFFQSDIKDEKAKKKLVELTRLTDNVNTQMFAVDMAGIALAEKWMNRAHDLFLLFESMTEIMGIQWEAAHKLAFAIIEQAFLAGAASLAMIRAAVPWAIPWAIGAGVTLAALQIQAYQDLEEQGKQASDAYYRAQQTLQIAFRFTGV